MSRFERLSGLFYEVFGVPARIWAVGLNLLRHRVDFQRENRPKVTFLDLRSFAPPEVDGFSLASVIRPDHLLI